MCVCACVGGGERESVCVCVCVWGGEGERERVCVRARARVLISFLCSVQCLRQHATVSHFQSMNPKLICNVRTERRPEQSVNPKHV